MSEPAPLADELARLRRYPVWWAVLAAATFIVNFLEVQTRQLGWYVAQVVGYTFLHLLSVGVLTGVVWMVFWSLHQADWTEPMTARGGMATFTVLLALSIIGQVMTA